MDFKRFDSAPFCRVCGPDKPLAYIEKSHRDHGHGILVGICPCCEESTFFDPILTTRKVA